MNLKAALAHEFEAVFLNTSEFAETMVIDGIPTPAMWGEETRPGTEAHGSKVDAWGLVAESAVLHLAASRFPSGPPVPGQEIEVDGQVWTVAAARERFGGLRLALNRNSS